MMVKKSYILNFFFCVAVLTLLTACGGGTSSDDNNNDNREDSVIVAPPSDDNNDDGNGAKPDDGNDDSGDDAKNTDGDNSDTTCFVNVDSDGNILNSNGDITETLPPEFALPFVFGSARCEYRTLDGTVLAYHDTNEAGAYSLYVSDGEGYSEFFGCCSVDDPLSPNEEYRKNSGAEAIGAGVAYERNHTGAGVTVSVIGGAIFGRGYDLTEALVQGYVASTGDSSENAGTCEGSDCRTQSNIHSTYIATIIAARQDGKGIQGIAYNANIKPIDIINSPDDLPEKSRFASIFARNNAIRAAGGMDVAAIYFYQNIAQYTDYIDDDTSYLYRGPLDINVSSLLRVAPAEKNAWKKSRRTFCCGGSPRG